MIRDIISAQSFQKSANLRVAENSEKNVPPVEQSAPFSFTPNRIPNESIMDVGPAQPSISKEL